MTSVRAILALAIAGILASTVGFAGPGCAGSSQGAQRPPVVLAVAGPMTGPSAFQGKAMAEAAQLAVEQANASGGVNGRAIELRILDDANDPTRGTEIARSLAADPDVLAVIGHRTSGVCVAAGKVYREAGLPAITASATDPEVTLDNSWYFRALFDNDAQGRFLAIYAREGLGLTRVGLVNAGRSLAQAFRPAAQTAGVQIVQEWNFDAKAVDDAALTRIVDEVKSCKDCQGLVLLASEVPAREFLRVLRDAAVSLPVLAGQALGREGFPDLFRDLPREQVRKGIYTDNLYAIAVALPDIGGEVMQAFVRAYREHYGSEPDSSAAAYYDATRMVIAAASRAGVEGATLASDRQKIRDALAQVQTPDVAHPGATGPIFFDARRTAVKSIAVGTFLHGVLSSAPTQLALVADPVTVPDATDRLREGTMIQSANEVFAKIQVVYVGLDIIAVPEVDLQAGTFKADLFVWFRYQGDLDVGAIEFATADEAVDLGTPLWRRNRGDITTATYRVKTNFRGAFDFHDYPFDTQKLGIELRHRTRTTASLILALDRLGMRTADEDLDLRDKLTTVLGSKTWGLIDAVTYQDSLRSTSTLGEIGVRSADAGLIYSRINATMTIGRDVSTYGLRNLLPLLAIIVVLYVSYFLPREELGTRSTLGVTALLSVTVLYQQLASELPSIGYLVTMDYGFYAAFALSMLATLITILVFLAERAGRPRVGHLLDWAGRTITPIVLGVMIVLVILKYGDRF